MKRLGIFVFYDKEGIVDNYVVYLLENIKAYLDRLVIVCNGVLNKQGREKLEDFTKEIYVRENTGYDAMAYKLAMTQYLGWDEVQKYDEVLMFNDTFFGPFYPFSEVFGQMDDCACDFWGMTYHAQAYDYFYGTNDILPAHVHTYFFACRRSVTTGSAFQDYWNAFDSTQWFFSDVARHEQFFTKYLEDAGFHWAAYIDASVYNTKEPGSNFNHYYYIADLLIREYRCPIIKRKNFVIKHMSAQAGNTGEDIADAFHFIQSETGYDTGMIWDNILRLYNVLEIKNALHLDYIVPWEEAAIECSGDTLINTAVIVHLYYEKMFHACMKYLQNVPDEIDIYILTSNPDIAGRAEKEASKIRQVRVLQTPDKGRDLGALLVGCREIFKNYTYICFVHDRKSGESVGPATIGRSFFYNMWENMLKSNIYIKNVLNLFSKNKRLGFLASPPPVHAEFFGSIGLEWHNDYENTAALADKIGLKTNFSPDLSCFALGNAFWCRSEALMPLIDYGFDWDDFPKEPMPLDGTISHALERIYPYVAQSQGYYSGCLMNTDYASLNNTNLYYYLSGVLTKIRTQQMVTDYDSVFQSDILSYCQGKKNVLIYGAGTNGIKASNILKQNSAAVRGFVVSDDQPGQKEKNGYPIYRLSEIPYEKDETGIIVSVAYTRDRREILANLEQKGYKDYYLL